MSLKSSLESVGLLIANMDTNKPTVYKGKNRKIDKPSCFPEDAKINYLPRCKPEKLGVDKKYLQSFVNELFLDYSIRTNRLIIVKQDKVVFERYEHPYVKEAWDHVFSATKTVVALALGIILDEEKLNFETPAYELLGLDKLSVAAHNRAIKLKHLLTMSTGNTFNEMSTPTSTVWIKDYFSSPAKFKIGTKFEYNSLNTYIIAAIVEKYAGKKFHDFVRERIFDPLGISATYMETSSEGYVKAGWGLYILPEDMVKLGILVKDYGVFNGQKIVSKMWIKEMTKKQFAASEFGHRYDYGYQMWVDEKSGFSCFNGMYDQDILIYRNTDYVIVTCSSNNEAFHGANLYNITTKYFAKGAKDFPLCEMKTNRELKNYESLMYYYDLIANKEFLPIDKVANSCGLLPLLLQNEMSTYAKGIKSIKFLKEEDKYYLLVIEDGKEYKLAFNFKEGVRQVIEFYRNKYDCSVDARFILNGKSEPFLVIRLFFLEFSHTRYITIKFGKSADALSIELSENPGLGFVMSIVEVQDESTKAFIKNAINLVNPDILSSRIKNIFAPRFRVVQADKVMLEKNKKPRKS